MAPTTLPLAVAGGTPVRRDFLVFGTPRIGEAEIAEVVATLRSGWIGTGPRTERFERAFADYVGVGHAIGVSSCTAALHLSLVAAGIGPGDEVIVPAMTFVATANSVVHTGATPVLCDVDRHHGNVRLEDLSSRVTSRTRALIPVHFAGRPVDLTDVEPFAESLGLVLIGDCAHAIEAEHRGRKVGAFGAFAAYSFYPTKNLTTGEGGMVVTGDEQAAARVRTWRLHGLSADAWKRYSAAGFQHYEAAHAGFKYNMTDLQAAIGLHQLARIEEASARRLAVWKRYDAAFASLPLATPPAADAGTRHARHLYTVSLDLERLTAPRDVVAAALQAEGIGVGVHYRGVHLHEYYRQRFGCTPELYPNATWLSERTLSLPLSAGLDYRDVDDVIEAVSRVLTAFSA